MLKKLKHLIALTEKLQVKHFLYLGFFSVLGLLIFLITTLYYPGTEVMNDLPPSDAFTLSVYGFIILGIVSFFVVFFLLVINIISNIKIHKFLRLLFLLIICTFISAAAYKGGYEAGKDSVVIEYTREDMESMCSILVEKATEKIVVPYCGIRGCPEYQAWNGQSIVYQPTTMTKGGAEILIINHNKIVFRSGTEAMLDYKIFDDESGIILSYVKEFDETGLNPKTWAIKEILYSEENDEWTEQEEVFLDDKFSNPDTNVPISTS